MDFLAHPLAERRINELVTGNAGLARERGTDDQCAEVTTVTLDLEHTALEAGGYVASDILSCWFHREIFQFRSL